MISRCIRFSYLNDKIHEINTKIEDYVGVIDHVLYEIIDTFNVAIFIINNSYIPIVKELDDMYVEVKNETYYIPKFKKMNQTLSSRFTKLYMEISHKYGYNNVFAKHIFDLDNIWGYLPSNYRSLIMSMVEDAETLMLCYVVELISMIRCLHAILSPFVLSNALDNLINAIETNTFNLQQFEEIIL